MELNSAPFFSIITVNLNNCKGLKYTINSVKSQNSNDHEFLIIDGGSTDDSIEVIRENKDIITKWVSEKDLGIYHAMNKGIKMSSGMYLLFLNSGDYLVDNMILENVARIQKGEDVLFGNLVVVKNHKKIGRINGKEKLTFQDIYFNRVKHQASFIKKELFAKYGLYDETLTIISDWDFFIKTLGIGNASYRYLNMDISNYDNDGLSNVKNIKNKSTKERQIVMDRYIPTNIQSDYTFFNRYYSYKEIISGTFLIIIIRLLKLLYKIFK